MRRIIASFAFLLALLTPVFAVGQGFVPAAAPPAVYADNYGRWVLQGQQANTYTFQVSGFSPCQITQLNFSDSSTFYAFSNAVALAPVFIQDNNSANSEVVTPGSFLPPSPTSCGPALAPVNAHTTFSLQSGTGGLQEALNIQGAATTGQPSLIILSKEWYKLLNGIAGSNATLATTVQPSLVIRAAKCAVGSAGAIVQDITTSPAMNYVCGSAGTLVADVAGSAFPNLRVTSFTGISAPTALTTATSAAGMITTGATGGTIPASSTYRLAVTYVDASGGETLISMDSASTSTIATGAGSTNTLVVTSPAAATGVVGYRLYVSAASGAAGSEILYTPTCSFYSTTQLQSIQGTETVCPIGATATVTAIVTGTATVPPISTAFPRTSGTSLSFPPFAAGGVVATTATGTLGMVTLPAGYLNTLGRQVTFCGNANVTTNSTPGTIALGSSLYSIAGVTSISPFTVTSGTTTASAQVPINFCITYETAATGATGTLWVHGWANFVLNSAANTTATSTADTIFAVSSTIDLTKKIQVRFTFTPTTTGSTAFQMTQLWAIPSN